MENALKVITQILSLANIAVSLIKIVAEAYKEFIEDFTKRFYEKFVV